ncbi:hypothetical protein LTR85_007926 [Meristemomyces frigidus]|nr:hypothetical protein LTR85_007926 [Meristemomyces frigidus]
MQASSSGSSSSSSSAYRSAEQAFHDGILDLRRAQSQQEDDDMPPLYEDLYPDSSVRSFQLAVDDSKQRNGTTSAHLPGAQAGSSLLRRLRFDYAASDDEILRQALECTRHTPRAHRNQQRLRRPVVIPQVEAGAGMPFTRAYAPALAEHGVSMDEFVSFVDNLNVMLASSPPLQVLDLAGGIVGFVPLQTAQLVGLGIAASGNVAVMMTRGSQFMKRVNSNFFDRRGLKVELAASEAVKAGAGVRPGAPLAAPVEQSEGSSGVGPKMATLQDFVEPLTFVVPPASAPTNVLGPLSAKQQAVSIPKHDEKAGKDRAKYAGKGDNIDREKPKKARKLDREIQKLDREREREERKRDRKLQKITEKKRKEDTIVKKEDKVTRGFERDIRKLDKEYDKLHEKFDEQGRKGEKDRRKEDKEGMKAQTVLHGGERISNSALSSYIWLSVYQASAWCNRHYLQNLR